MVPEEDEDDARTAEAALGMVRQTSFVAMNDISPSLQTMRVDEDGASELEEVSRTYLLQMANDYARKSGFPASNVRPRDLRILDAMFEPSLAVRHFCILINLPPVRCLVFPNSAFLIIDAGADDTLIKFKNHVASLQNTFELRVLETALWQCTSVIEKQQADIEVIVQRVSKQKETPEQDEQTLRDCQKRIAKLKTMTMTTRAALHTLLSYDADMALVNLSRLVAEPDLFKLPEEEWAAQHIEVEILLEAYGQRLTASFNKLGVINQEVSGYLSKARIRRVSWRNRMIKLETFMRALTASAGMGAFIAACFGMNLNSGIQSIEGIFWPFFGGQVALVVVIFIAAVWVINEEG